MVLTLEQIWLPRARRGTEGPFDPRWADASYSDAFRAYGIDVEALDFTEAGRLIRDRAISLELAAAIDTWADRRQQSLQPREVVWDGWPDDRVPIPEGNGTSWRRLVDVARVADPDEWRNQVRDALRRRDRKALSRLAASSRASDLPVQTLSVVCRHLDATYAIPVLRRAQLEHPDNHWINFQLAWNYSSGSSSSLDDAIRHYTAALAIRPRNASTAYFLGEALRSRGKFVEAIPTYRKAIALDPDLLGSYRGLIESLLSQGMRDEALAEIRAEVAAKPDRASLKNKIAWILAAVPDPRSRDSLMAVELATRATELNPDEGAYWNTLGAARYRAGDWEGAIAAFEKSMALRRGGNSYDWFLLSMACLQLNRGDEALRWYDRAVIWMEKHDPGHLELSRFRAEARELLQAKHSARPADKQATP
jgi:tetratricopeptide (TPR) repeat protein